MLALCEEVSKHDAHTQFVLLLFKRGAAAADANAHAGDLWQTDKLYNFALLMCVRWSEAVRGYSRYVGYVCRVSCCC